MHLLWAVLRRWKAARGAPSHACPDSNGRHAARNGGGTTHDYNTTNNYTAPDASSSHAAASDHAASSDRTSPADPNGPAITEPVSDRRDSSLDSFYERRISSSIETCRVNPPEGLVLHIAIETRTIRIA